MPKKLKPQNIHETLALRILKTARKLRLTYVTDDELLEGIRGKNVPPLPLPADRPAKLTEKEWESILQLFAQVAAARATQYHAAGQAQGTPGPFPGPFPFPGQLPPQIPQTSRPVPWRVILGIPQDKPVTAADVHARWKLLTTVYHPDRGGSKEAFQAITDARDYAIRELGSK